ncbi:MAG: hypothetical protein GC186_01545 [Rhodobacteraceae bacterium]|nr:hypothetical protein [Paracoccaceae bacterium]
MTHQRASAAASRPAVARRGVLMLIAILLASAGAIRLGLGLREARALDAPSVAPVPKPVACPTAGDPVMPLVAALRAREDRVAAREAAVADRAQALALSGRVVDDKLAALKAAEDSLSAKLTLADGAAEADVARLTTVYESMKPKDAAAVFQQMAPDFAAGFLGRMKPESAALILSGLTPEKAYTVSVILAGRNAAAPKN